MHQLFKIAGFPYSHEHIEHSQFHVNFSCIQTTKQFDSPCSSWPKVIDVILKTNIGIFIHVLYLTIATKQNTTLYHGNGYIFNKNTKFNIVAGAATWRTKNKGSWNNSLIKIKFILRKTWHLNIALLRTNNAAVYLVYVWIVVIFRMETITTPHWMRRPLYLLHTHCTQNAACITEAAH